MGCTPRKILHVIDTLEYGGAQRLLVLFSSHSPADQYRLIICSLQPGNDLKGPLEAAGAEVICFERSRPSILHFPQFLQYALESIQDLREICEERKIDVIQCHLSDSDFIGTLVGRWCKVEKVITTIHSTDFLPPRRPRDTRNKLRVLATKLYYRKWVDYIVAVSEDSARKVREQFNAEPDKIRVILNGIDVDAFETKQPSIGLRSAIGIEAQDKVLICVGRLVQSKGHKILFDAMLELTRGWSELKLILVGDGESRKSLERQCQELNLMDRVLFLGSRPDVAALLAISDVFVLPSLIEATSLALLEAMASRRPVVATSIPGNAAVIENGVSGLLVPPGDSRELATALDFLLRHPERGQAFGNNAHQVVKQRYDVRQTIKELQSLWS
jgi:glycosyltransferase involved in cell wall biosynthesis